MYLYGDPDVKLNAKWRKHAKALRKRKVFFSLTAAGDIDFVGCGVTDEALAIIADVDTITKIGASSSEVTDEGLKHIARMAGLEELLLDRSQVTGHGLAALADCAKLNDLYCSDMPDFETGVRHIGQIKSLKSISLNSRDLIPASAFDTWKSSNLTRVEYYCELATDEHVESFARIYKLEHLSVSGHKVTNHSLELLSKLAFLSSLSVGDANIDDKGVLILPSFRALRSLLLSGTKITSTGCRWFPQIPNLQELSLTGTAVGDDAIAYFIDCPGLSYLELLSTQITKEGFLRLRQSMPDCDIYVNTDIDPVE